MAFKLKPDKKESENKTIRFPVDLIDEINTAIAKKEVSFSGFVIQAWRLWWRQFPEFEKIADIFMPAILYFLTFHF